MSRSSTLILLGALIILAPFSGLPVATRALLTVVLGACVLGNGLALRAREARNHQPPPEPQSPQQSNPTI